MISIIIINYNSLKFLYKNLNSIIKSDLDNIEYEIIIIDNNSKNKPDNVILSRYNAKIYFLNRNSGYSKALNYGIKKCNGKYILSLNADVYLKDKSIKKLYNYYNTSNVGILGCKILNNDGSFQLSSRRKFPFLKYIIPYMFYIRKTYNYLEYDNNEIQEVDSISGCCMYFSRDVYDKVEGFDENFFLYFEDTDFCLRANKLGYKVIYYPKSEVFHFKYGSRNFSNYFYVKYQFYKSFIIFIKKYLNHYI